MAVALALAAAMAATASAGAQAGTAPPLSVSLSTPGNFTVGQSGLYSVTITNTGSTPTTGTITVSDTLPTGLSFQSASGTGWACSSSGAVTCTTSTSIAGGKAAPAITLQVLPDLTATDYVQNTATASLAGFTGSVQGTATTAVLTAYGPQSLIGTSLPEAFGVAVDAKDNVFVADSNKNVVLERTRAGTQIVLPITGLNLPRGVAVDKADDVFVADSGNNRIEELPYKGTQTTLAFTGLNQPRGVAVDGRGDVFVADTYNNQVVELPFGGTQRTVGFTGLNQPRGLAVDRPGDVFVADTFNNQVVELPVGGTQQTLAFSGLNQPVGVAIDGDGTVFVSDPPNQRVVALPLHGVQQLMPFTGLSDPRWLAVDPAGNVFLTDTTLTGIIYLPSDIPILSIALGSSKPFTIGQDGTYTVNLTNAGLLSTVGTITVTDVLPTGISYVSSSGTGWTCADNGQRVTCTTTSPIPSGAKASKITITVLPGSSAGTSVTDTVGAYGGGAETNTTASHTTVVQ